MPTSCIVLLAGRDGSFFRYARALPPGRVRELLLTLLLFALVRGLADTEPFTHDELEPRLRAMTEDLGLKAGVSFMALRVAITGRTRTPPLTETMEVLGKARTLRRIRDAMSQLAEAPPVAT